MAFRASPRPLTRRQFVQTGSLMGLGAVLAACGSTGGSGSQNQLSSFTVIQSDEVVQLQPDIDWSATNLRYSRSLFDAATTYVPNGAGLKLVPSLATSWNQVDASTWRFHVRPKVVFSNGEPVTADAFKFSVETYYSDASKGAALLPGLKVNVVDPMTFDVITPTPNYESLPAEMSDIFVYPPQYYAAVGKQKFGAAPIGTGPYLLQNWDRGVQIQFKKNPKYFGPAPGIPNLTIKWTTDESTRISQLQTGEAQIITDLSPQLSGRVASMRNANLVTQKTLRRVFLGINCLVPPTDNVLVRQAMNYAIDMPAIIKSLFKGRAYAIKGIFLPGEMGYTPQFSGYPHDPARAKSLLAQAGYSQGVSIDFHYPIGSYPLDQQTAQVIQSQFAAVGIHLNMLSGTGEDILQLYSGRKATGITMYSFGPIYEDPAFECTLYFSRIAGYPYYHDEKEYAMVDQAQQETDPGKRKALYQQIQAYVMKQAQWVPLYGELELYGVANTVDWKPDPLLDDLLRLESAKPSGSKK